MDDDIGGIIDSLNACGNKVQLCLAKSKNYIWGDKLPQIIDEFDSQLLDSAEYAVFLIRAIIGNWEGIKICSATWKENQITLCINDTTNIQEKINQIRNDYDRQRGADLVARSSLILAWEICRKFESQNFYPCLDKADHPKASGNGKLSFRSSDFVRARKKDIDNGDDSGESIRYNFDSEDWQTFGWRTHFESNLFGGRSNESESTEPVESFLRFPAFYKYEVANITFAFSKETSSEVTPLRDQECEKLVNDEAMSALNERGINPYIEAKVKEFVENFKCEYDYSVTTCLGIASYPGIHFKDEDFEAGYGIFITIDFGVPEGHCLEDKKIDKKILDTVKSAQHRIRLIVLQALNAWLLEEEKKLLEERAEHAEAQAMVYDYIKGPIGELTDLLHQAHKPLSELTSVMSPMNQFIWAGKTLAPFFIANDSVTLGDFGYKDPSLVSLEVKTFHNFQSGKEQEKKFKDLIPSILLIALGEAGNARAPLWDYLRFYLSVPPDPNKELADGIKNTLPKLQDNWESISKKPQEVENCFNTIKSWFNDSYKPGGTLSPNLLQLTANTLKINIDEDEFESIENEKIVVVSSLPIDTIEALVALHREYEIKQLNIAIKCHKVILTLTGRNHYMDQEDAERLLKSVYSGLEVGHWRGSTTSILCQIFGSEKIKRKEQNTLTDILKLVCRNNSFKFKYKFQQNAFTLKFFNDNQIAITTSFE